MDLHKLSILKEKLMVAKDFNKPWEYFFDHFGENPAFLDLGERTENPTLEAAIIQIGKQVFQREDVTVSHLLLIEIKAHKFIHGTCFLQGKVVTVFFFYDIDMGLFAASLGGSEVSLARFSSMELGKHKDVFFVPSTNKTVH